MENNMSSLFARARGARLGWVAALLVCCTASMASAETLLMPKRSFLMGASEVVWGVTDLPNGTAFTLDYGDGTAPTAGNVVDRSYIAFNHTYGASGTFTVRLTVGGEVATVDVDVYNSATLSAFDLRALHVNRAIQNGLRYLWQAQLNRAANFPANPLTQWGSGDTSYGPPYAALIALAFQNHGYHLPNNNNAPTGIYEKYVVNRALNYVASRLQPLTLQNQPAGNPCVGAISDPCIGLYHTFDPGYSNGVVALPFAASNALDREIPAGIGNATYVAEQTFRSILQRMMNALAHGQNDYTATNNNGRGGWIYQFSNSQVQQSDGSTVGWDVLALLDATAANTTIPAFVKPEFANHALPQGLNNDGSFDYRADNAPTSPNSTNVAKAGIGLQGQFYAGQAPGMGVTYISNNWNATPNFQSFTCGNGTWNKGCAYAMFNVFKALKLHGVATLPGVGRPAGPGPIPANDWYADYVDWLVANQTAPTSPTGGYWTALDFSCCESDNTALDAAMAELILSPVALIQPDPGHFSSFGLSQSHSVNPPNTAHTVVARTRTADDQPVPGVTIDFRVLTGPNQGVVGQAVTNAQGEATFTYIDTSTGPYPQQDEIRAFVGTLGSNIIVKAWVLVCDSDDDGDIDSTDLAAIRAANNQNASPLDPRDANGDGRINVLDGRYCQLRCTRPGCATQ